jgi:hypothetical protein
MVSLLWFPLYSILDIFSKAGASPALPKRPLAAIIYGGNKRAFVVFAAFSKEARRC